MTLARTTLPGAARTTLLGAAALACIAGCGGGDQAHRAPPGGGGRACTLIGCSSGAQVDMTALPLQPGPKSEVTVCVDTTCSSRSPEALPLVGAQVDAPYTNESAVTVTLTMVGPDGTVVAHSSIRARLRRNQPNGPGCMPVCFITRLELTASGRLRQA